MAWESLQCFCFGPHQFWYDACVHFKIGQPSIWQWGHCGLCYVHGNLGYVSNFSSSVAALLHFSSHRLNCRLWCYVVVFFSHPLPWAVEETQSQTCFSVEGVWLVRRGGTAFCLSASTKANTNKWKQITRSSFYFHWTLFFICCMLYISVRAIVEVSLTSHMNLVQFLLLAWVLDFQSRVFFCVCLIQMFIFCPTGGTGFGNNQWSKLQSQTIQALVSAQHTSIHIDNSNGKKHWQHILNQRKFPLKTCLCTWIAQRLKNMFSHEGLFLVKKKKMSTQSMLNLTGSTDYFEGFIFKRNHSTLCFIDSRQLDAVKYFVI